MPEIEKEYTHSRISVPAEFESVFSHFYFAENNTEQPVTKTLLPTYQTILLFCFGENATMVTKENTVVEVDKCIAFGPVRQAFNYTLPSKTSILAANFKDDAFYRFFGKAVIEKHSVVHPDHLLNENCFTDLWHELSAIYPATEKVSHILEFCQLYLQDQEAAAKLLSRFKEENLNPVKIIAEQTRQSERNIQLKQKEQFGYSSKEINRYHRFLKAIQLIEKNIAQRQKVEWFEIISACNYYDQSQLIHDFKHFLHLSPSRYLRFQQDICNPKSG
ncbi:helix-turn-helix domain-containing protein [Chryseobacterium populi]|uniref:DNA-binding domain-containing protein, AraC-type n=1 Tax=Chryseobacterium populi TaxID=1144316 RepID=J3CMS6_9FLAO|nr:helix-turn-helix domain-containing protein [Chryseobacterium populi]EJL74834.1 DNA-binding domain-containing protein, AraC-type [Chryseobacterium populi]